MLQSSSSEKNLVKVCHPYPNCHTKHHFNVCGWVVFKLDIFAWQFGTKLIFTQQVNMTKTSNSPTSCSYHEPMQSTMQRTCYKLVRVLIRWSFYLSFSWMKGCNFSKYSALNSLHCTVYIKIYFKHIFFHSWIFRKMEHSNILHIKFTENIKKSSHKICGPSFLPFLIYTSLTLDISSISGWTFVEHSVTNQSHAFNSSQLTLGSSSFQYLVNMTRMRFKLNF